MRKSLLVAVAAIVSGFYLFPVYWMYASALKVSDELNANPPTLIPHAPTLAAFRWIFERENVAQYLWLRLLGQSTSSRPPAGGRSDRASGPG